MKARTPHPAPFRVRPHSGGRGIPLRLPLIAGKITSIIAFFVLFIFVVPASARELRIESFHSELVVMPDSSLDVTETIQVQFIGSWNGIFRTIPVEYPSPSGFNYSLFLADVSASEAGTPSLKIDRRREGPNLNLKIYVPGAQDSKHTVSLHYRVRNGLRYFEDHDELYWNVAGTDWTVPLGNASAHVVLPAGVTGVRAAQYTGAYGSRGQDAQVQVIGSNVDVRSTRPLAYREGLTIAIAWDKGFVRQPSSSQLFVQFMRSNWPLFLPVMVFFGMLWLWYTRGRDPQVGSVAVQYGPPDGLSPGELGTLVDDSVHMRDITAGIVDLAVKGYLEIEERKTDHLMGLYSSESFAFILKKKPSEWKGAKPHELLLLAGLFSNGIRDQVELSELQNRFYKNLPGIRTAIFDALVDRGYYAHRPDQTRGVFIGIGFVTGTLLFLMGQYFADKLGMQSAPFLIAGALTGAIILAFGWFMPARTASGARARLDALGFENFITHVEADRMERIPQTPETFEKFLPFAMALGVEKKWVSAFDNVAKQPPSWYHAPPGMMFRPMIFANSLSSMTAQTSHAMTSAPRSSSGASGFGGGGSSGGGFGGGGGGGF